MTEGPALIHIWDVDPDQEATAVAHLEALFKDIVKDPGFLSARVLESPDRTSIAAIIQWRSAEDRQRVEQLPEVRETLHDLHGTANLVIRLYHQVAEYTV